jgi:hypothetical protein
MAGLCLQVGRPASAVAQTMHLANSIGPGERHIEEHVPAWSCEDEPRTRYKYKIRVRFSGRGHEGVQNIEFYHWSNEVTQ